MAEYIEREAVEMVLENAQIISDGEYNGYCTADVRLGLDSIPAADVVEVVRCKDCRWYDRGFCNCDQWWNDDRAVGIDDNDFCSYGCAKMDGKGEGE